MVEILDSSGSSFDLEFESHVLWLRCCKVDYGLSYLACCWGKEGMADDEVSFAKSIFRESHHK